jgi:hypothetical protein
MKNIKTLITIMISMLVLGCTGYHEQVTQRDESSYVQFVGKHNGEIIVIDNENQYVLMTGSNFENIDGNWVKDGRRVLKSFYINQMEATKIQINKGKHSIKVYRSNDEQGNPLVTQKDLINNEDNLIIDKDIYISSGTTYEIEL